MTDAPARVAVAGAGWIGRDHVALVQADPETELSALVDPAPAAREVADQAGVPLHGSLAGLFAADRPDAVILATPNRLHLPGALECLAAGVPVLVEKPVTATLAEGRELVAAAEAGSTPVLVGHHRRHSPLLATARQAIDDGLLGRVVTVTGTALFHKPDSYFEAEWHTKAGAGPILSNMVHEVDDLRSLCGEVVAVQAMSSHAVRGYEVEDTAVVTLAFASGALGTFAVSDSAASSRSWEQTSGENPAYACYPEDDCYLISGTRGSLAVPTMRLRTFTGPGSWNEPFDTRTLEVDRTDPLAAQLAHFVRVVRGEQVPAVTPQDALRSLQTTLAIAEAARSRSLVEVDQVR